MLAGLPERQCMTKQLKLHDFHEDAERFGHRAVYGADAAEIERLALQSQDLADRFHDDLPYTGAEIAWGARHEMARTVEDALARRTRALALNARAAVEMAPKAAAIMARELGRDKSWQQHQVEQFSKLASGHVPSPL
jgi:glycerol-3-phosphate dehydrogenase